MKHTLAFFIAVTLAGPLHAACYVDYKAKQDDPLRLHYGVASVATCAPEAAATELAPRLAADGWTLLNVVSVFEDDALDAKKENAGDFFLRY